MDKMAIVLRKEAIVERLKLFEGRLKGRMRTREVILLLGLKPWASDRAALTAALTEIGMASSLTERPDVFNFK